MRNSINDNDSFDCRVLKHLPADSYIDLEDSEEEEEESNLEMGCPYCLEGFDAIGLCVHLEDQHPLEIKLGVCPLCATNLGRNMISHLIIEHESVLKLFIKKLDPNHYQNLRNCMQGLCKRKLHDDDTLSILSLLKKKLQEHSHSLQKELTSVTSSNSSATDPLLLSFVYDPSQTHEPLVDSSAEPSASKILPMDDTLKSGLSASSFDCKDTEEKAQKSDFIQTMLLSTIFYDIL